MKIVSIKLSDRRAADIDTALASGDYTSISELVDAALEVFLTTDGPSHDRVEADIDAYEAARARGERPIPGDEAFDGILSNLRR
jgi:Arc/MetJ-type ribon-helix-helix transcriptional regulator